MIKTATIEQVEPEKIQAFKPAVKKLQYSDITKAMRSGLRDFARAPQYGIAFGLAYAAFGWFLLYLLNTLEINYYVYPMATGFALLAPFVASGLYEVSHTLEDGKKLSWGGVFTSTRRAGGKDLSWMAVVTTFAYIIWLDIAVALYVIFFGLKSLAFTELVTAIMTTPSGFLFFVIGNTAGAILALIVFSLTVVSLPLLFDKHVDFVTAMITSVKVVLENPKPMLLWCAIIGVLFAISLLSMFVALIVVLPILGHSTWHLYKRAVGEKEPAGEKK
ncbi:hypothetical protein MNBD_ALPHA08-779 [hydrothermal vent metagenome]|uniref:Cytochrome c oxidase, subunit I n=1 Tax=hydrothermal vent metagenome TaxID=652676 RepID=A0A3B0SRX7_9ZZZZ